MSDVDGQEFVNIAVQGCCHGELDSIYNAILETQRTTQQQVDLLIICGDMQCIRHSQDLQSLAVPPKYRQYNTFHQYVTGEKTAPIPTVFIGGNHEASNLLQSLYYGGYVAPNIYYMGFAGVIRFRGLRIAGLSGIYNDRHYQLGHYEIPPYTEDTMRSVYHLRELEVYRMMHLKENCNLDPIDVFLSHDWPSEVWQHGDTAGLLRVKPYFKEDMKSGKLGSPPLKRIMSALMPDFWFAAHLHVKFAAVVAHHHSLPPISTSTSAAITQNPEEIDIDDLTDATTNTTQNTSIFPAPNFPIAVNEIKTTRFLALDKVIPGRGFMQFLQIPARRPNEHCDSDIHFDTEWMSILRKTHHLLSTTYSRCTLPQTLMSVTSEEREDASVRLKGEFGDNLTIPNIDPIAVEVLQCTTTPFREGNYQTDRILKALEMDHIWTVPAGNAQFKNAPPPPQLMVPVSQNIPVVDPNEIDI